MRNLGMPKRRPDAQRSIVRSPIVLAVPIDDGQLPRVRSASVFADGTARAYTSDAPAPPATPAVADPMETNQVAAVLRKRDDEVPRSGYIGGDSAAEVSSEQLILDVESAVESAGRSSTPAARTQPEKSSGRSEPVAERAVEDSSSPAAEPASEAETTAGSVSEETMLADIQSILAEPAAQSRAATASRVKRTASKSQRDGELGDASVVASQPAQKPETNRHDIFEQLAQSMDKAQRFDLGSVVLEQRFDRFDNEMDGAEGDGPVPSGQRQAPVPARDLSNDPRAVAAEGAKVPQYTDDQGGEQIENMPRAQEDEGYFTDTEELRAYMRDQRAADTTRVSMVASAQAIVDDYISRGANSVWQHVNAVSAARGIGQRCADSRLIDQANLNLCGPSAFLMVWAGRDPVGYARYGIGMLEHGRGAIGSKQITADSDLLSTDYSAMRIADSDLVCGSPLRDNANDILPYDPGSSIEALQGATTPGEIAGWLRDTGIFRTVRDEANWARGAGIDHALGLLPGGRSDIILLIHTNALARASSVELVDESRTHNRVTLDDTFILSNFPNHFVVLVADVVPDVGRRTVSLTAWTWGGTYVFREIPVREFSTNYFGAVRTTLAVD